jgi:hypothetical protein
MRIASEFRYATPHQNRPAASASLLPHPKTSPESFFSFFYFVSPHCPFLVLCLFIIIFFFFPVFLLFCLPDAKGGAPAPSTEATSTADGCRESMPR